MDDEGTGHEWERMAGHDFREDIPPSFEWWRKFVYEPAHKEIGVQVTAVNRKVDAQSRLLWGLLVSNLAGMIGIIGILITRH